MTYISKRELKRRYESMTRTAVDLAEAVTTLEESLGLAVFIIEENKITNYKEEAEDVNDFWNNWSLQYILPDNYEDDEWSTDDSWYR